MCVIEQDQKLINNNETMAREKTSTKAKHT